MTDVPGIWVGHYTDTAAASGTTVVICADGAVGGVDVRGAAPGTRETDLLAPENLVEKVQAVCLSGGSVYGLAAADGVVRHLESRAIGFQIDDIHVAPIVPAAVLFDLGRGLEFRPPVDSSWGELACRSAGPGPVKTGCVGAGTGAMSGGIKGGVGSASLVLDMGIIVAALVVVNSLGSTVDPATGTFWEARLESGKEFAGRIRPRVVLPATPTGTTGENTTLAVVATDAVLTKPQAKKIAMMAHDGMARAIRPAHTMFDGDIVYCLATAKQPLPEKSSLFTAPVAQTINELGHAAADCLARAIIRGILDAQSSYGLTAYRDLKHV
ncbi:P1 family peptidase [Desulfosarcina sp.]|uniref:P1 family peptidase n=1 Tax=Desulfosarcina sp. TaxID=2027861 RepID=UPI0029B932A7|nr:P1 family peptidase [Desulfosarcina sp.]MDX2451428.1 P1 family peptidase [Desulfosarcina sp.]MDX2489244.1 P1 family peptidase [Desulfosarcina sp.]